MGLKQGSGRQKPRGASIKIVGERFLVERVTDVLEKEFAVVRVSPIKLNDRDPGVHRYVHLVEA